MKRTHEETKDADTLDPATAATGFLSNLTVDRQPRLCFWRGEFLLWGHGAYRPTSKHELRGNVIKRLNRSCSGVTTTVTNNVVDQVRAQAMLPDKLEPHNWICWDDKEWPAGEIISARNGLVNLPLLAKRQECIKPATPRFFSLWALDFAVDHKALPPTTWLQFLDELWGDDAETIACLQELFGYLVAGGTWLQKIFALIGPKRAGKGVIARVIRNLVGPANCCGPTLSGLGGQFGLWSLMGKSVAVIADARLSGRTDQAVVVERLLSISGEDALTIDRKNLEPVTCTLPTRMVLISNELPRLGDSSGAMASRMILLRFTKSFYGNEDTQLTEKLLVELPGILLWATDGWLRLVERGHMIQPTSSAEMLADLEDLGSPVSVFIRERCIIDPGYMTAVSDIFAEWKAWCESKGRKDVGNEQTFGRDLSAAFPDLHKTQPRDGSGGRYRAYQGIGIRSSCAGIY